MGKVTGIERPLGSEPGVELRSTGQPLGGALLAQGRLKRGGCPHMNLDGVKVPTLSCEKQQDKGGATVRSGDFHNFCNPGVGSLL